MKSKITFRLILYFLLIVLIASFITGGVFMTLGQKAYIQSYKEDLANRAQVLAKGLSSHTDILAPMGQEGGSLGQGPRGTGKQKPDDQRISPRYLTWMNQVLEGEIWIVYQKDKVLQRGASDLALSYDDLSPQEQEVIDQAFAGQTLATDHFHHIFEEGSLSAAAPLQDQEGDIYGALLIHQNISLAEGLLQSAKGLLLTSTLFGILVASLLAILFAKTFIRPIAQINQVTKDLIAGDYTSQTHLSQEDEIGDLAKNIDALSLRLEKSRQDSQNLEKMRDRFMSNISHELKTPVTVMKSSLEGLVAGLIKEEDSAGYHRLLYEEISVLERLVTDLMELNAIKNTDFPFNYQDEDVLSILQDAVRSQRILARERGITLRLDLESDYHMMRCDYTRIRQMFITVINNAIKYSQSGGQVMMTSSTNQDLTRIHIMNQGSVISEEDLANLFTPFYRAKDTREKGFGLGLAIAKEIADRHQIALTVISTPESGTTFSFDFP